MRNETWARLDYLDPTNDARVRRLQTRRDVMVVRCVCLRDVVRQASHSRQLLSDCLSAYFFFVVVMVGGMVIKELIFHSSILFYVP